MQKIGDLLKDLGFDKDSSLNVQKAFVRNLIKQANINSKDRNKQVDQQLEFCFDQDQDPNENSQAG